MASHRAFALLAMVRNGWFYLLLPVWLGAAWSLSRDPQVLRDPPALELVLLFDFAIFLPALYALFLRRTVRSLGLAIRCGGLALSGLWLAGLLLPEGTGTIIPRLAWLRALFLPIALAIEIGAAIAVLRIVYAEEPDEARLHASGMPPWLVRLVLAEARFWKRVWRMLSGR